jgi:hypothetical protein
MLSMSLNRRAALVIAHPGHELRVLNWLGLARPTVFILTDGSGHFQNSRLHRTTKILKSLGAGQGSIYGRLTDIEIYSAMLRGDIDLFVGLAAELAQTLLGDRTEYIVGDADEGYNPAHDVCRMLINAAVKKAFRMGVCLENFEALMAYKSNDLVSGAMPGAISIDSDQQAQALKLETAREYSELTPEVNRILAQEGPGALGFECLRPVSDDSGDFRAKEPPYYEVYGAKQVAAGRYQQVIRYRDHILPIAEGLRRFAAGEGLAQVANSNHQ